MSIYIDNFETIYGTKGNIQALRSKVLELAIRGKLVEQDPNDEPASELIKRIKTDKTTLVKEGKIKKWTVLDPIADVEIPFEIPSNWEWVRLGDIGQTQTGTTPSTTNGEYYNGDIPFIKPADISSKGINYGNESLTALGLEVGRLVKKDSNMMVCIGGSIGKTYYTNRDCSCNQQINTLTPYLGIEHIYMHSVLSSLYFYNQVWKNSTGTATSIVNKSTWDSIFVPIPPLAEQRRIVAKVESLMAEIDKLEEYLQNKERLMGLLPQAVVDAIGSCKNGEELKEQLQFVISNFETIFQTPESMQDFRNVILQLAIEGKLVPQDPSDEPASELIKRIKTEKEELVKDGKIKKQAAIKPIETDEIPFEIPSNWEWVRLGGITNYGENITLAPEKVDSNAWVLELEDIEKNSSRILSVIYNKDRKTKSNKNQFHKGDVLYGKLRPYLKKILVAPDDGVCTTEIVAFRGYCDISSDYLVAYLKSAFVDNHINNLTYGIKMPRLGTDDAIELLVPLPPLREQLHIISKVESIMSFIDQMEAKMKLKLDLVEKMAST